MVSIVDYKSYEREDGTNFHTLKVQSGIEAVKSQTTQRTYFTAKTANVPCTFNEDVCKSLIGQTLPGVIRKVEVEPYEYTVRETGEVITLDQRNEYFTEEDATIADNVIKEELVVT